MSGAGDRAPLRTHHTYHRLSKKKGFFGGIWAIIGIHHLHFHTQVPNRFRPPKHKNSVVPTCEGRTALLTAYHHMNEWLAADWQQSNLITHQLSASESHGVAGPTQRLCNLYCTPAPP